MVFPPVDCSVSIVKCFPQRKPYASSVPARLSTACCVDSGTVPCTILTQVMFRTGGLRRSTPDYFCRCPAIRTISGLERRWKYPPRFSIYSHVWLLLSHIVFSSIRNRCRRQSFPQSVPNFCHLKLPFCNGELQNRKDFANLPFIILPNQPEKIKITRDLLSRIFT